MLYVHDPETPDPKEVERPCCYKEYSGPNECWEQIGMRIKWTIPEVPGTTDIHKNDPLILRLCLECKKPVPLRNVSVWAWTDLIHTDNHEGIYREVPMPYEKGSRKWDDNGVTCYKFQARVYPTHGDDFILTFNVKYGEYMLWVDKFQIDQALTVKPSRPHCKQTETPQHTQITRKVYLGNYLAVILADEMGYDAVLNLDRLTEEQVKRLKQPELIKVIRLSSGLDEGGGNEIPEEKIVEIVNWIRENNGKRKKILVGDQIGLGRVGSALTAYLYVNNPNLSYDEAYDFVRRRVPLAYCHKGLRDSLKEMYPRD